MKESLEAQAIRELGLTTCVCGAQKRRLQSFCGACYNALPKGMQISLYATVSHGYASNYDDAKDWLRINTDRISKAPRPPLFPEGA